MLAWSLPALFAVLLLGFLAHRWRMARPTRRVLPGMGSIDVPRRLETRAPRGGEGSFIFTFDRIAGGFSMMGSLTPVRERLSLMLLPEGAAADPAQSLESDFAFIAKDRIASPRWREEAGLCIGQGIHEVNGHETEAFVLLMALPSGDGLIGYMGWAKDITFERARSSLRSAASSLRAAEAAVAEDLYRHDGGSAMSIPDELKGVDGPQEQAEALIARLGAEPRFSGEQLPLLAGLLEQAAEAVGSSDAARGRWLYDRAIDHWYGWGAMATSGGDGAARAPEIRAAERRQKVFLDRLRHSGG